MNGTEESRQRTHLPMRMVSMYLPPSLVNEFKSLACTRNVGYQSLMRQVLLEFARAHGSAGD